VEPLWKRIGDCVPDDHARQVHSQYYLKEALTSAEVPDLIVDVGCGTGSSARFARKIRPDVRWVGLDVTESDNARRVSDEQVVLYDGVNLPFRDGSLPLIYSNQVFEHVRHPEPLLREIERVLRPGGTFIGSTSQLEPYHAWSLWNYTIYGFHVVIEDAGLVMEELRPGIDGIALIQRQYLGGRPEHNQWFRRSPLNAEIDEWGTATSQRTALINFRKLRFCGQFCFRVRKPHPGEALQLPWRKVPANRGTPSRRPLRQRMRRRLGRVAGWMRR
jgi:SAM-dependent methyltransferase